MIVLIVYAAVLYTTTCSTTIFYFYGVFIQFYYCYNDQITFTVYEY